jgi:hypothetical protein
MIIFSLQMFLHTRNETPLPNVTSPDTVRLSSSRQSGIL